MKLKFEKNKNFNEIWLEVAKKIAKIKSKEILNHIKQKNIRYKDDDSKHYARWVNRNFELSKKR